jgi:hypothetical protein
MLKKTIATSEQVAAISIEAALLFTWCIPFLDIAGRMYGSPARLKALVCPLRPELTPGIIERCLTEMHDVGLVVWYEAAGGKWLAFPGFLRHNKVRTDREAVSTIPPPPLERGALPAVSAPDDSGTNPGERPEYSGTTPAKGGKGSKGSKERKARGSEAPRGGVNGESFNFAPFVDAYRERFGADPDKRDAAVLKKLVAEHGHDEVLARWKRFVTEKGQFGVNLFRRTWADWGPDPTARTGGRSVQTAERLYDILTQHGLLDVGKDVFIAEVARLSERQVIRDRDAFMALVTRVDLRHLSSIPSRRFAISYIAERISSTETRAAS